METVQLTKEDLNNLLNQAKREPLIKGIHQLAKFLGVSPATAQRYKNEGKFPYFQDDRVLLFDPEKIREIINMKKAPENCQGQ